MTALNTAGASFEIKTIEDVANSLKHLDLPVPCQEAITVISAKESARFKSAIMKCRNKTVDAAGAMKYLRGITTCMTTPVMEALRGLGYSDVSWGTLFEVGKHKGLEFRAALSRAMTNKQPEKEQGLAIVKAILANPSGPVGSVHHIHGGDKPGQPQGDERKRPGSNDRATGDAGESPTSDTAFKSVHVYGGRNALCFNISETRAKGNKPAVPTIMIDAAEASGERQYDWANAFHFQLTLGEMSEMLALFMGWRNSVVFKGHGEKNEKSLEAERQKGKIFFKIAVIEAGIRPVPIGTKDAFVVATLLVEQLLKANPHLSAEHVFQITKSVSTLDAAA